MTATLTHVTGRTVEDNTVAILEFANGAVGVAETSFVSVYTPITIEISGNKGSMIINDKVPMQMKTLREDGFRSRNYQKHYLIL